MKRLLFILMALALLGTAALARGEDIPAPGDGTEGPGVGAAEPVATEPVATAAEMPPLAQMLEPDIQTWLGLRFFDVDDSRTRAAEFEWPYSSVAFGYRLNYSPLPHRLEAGLDWKDPYDLQAELAYDYRDMFKLNFTGWSLWHNLDHFVPQPSTILSDKDPEAKYHVTAEDDRIFVRLKWPERAYHLFVDFRQFEKEGTIQARFFEGGALSKVSRSRDIDWITRRYNIGMNGHFGILEVEYSHMLKTFEPHKDVELHDTISGRPNTVHSVVPELQTNSDTVKVHTDLTGSVVAAATFTNGEKQNFNSKSELDFHRFYGDLTAIPFEHVTVAVRYRFNQLMEEGPAVIGTNVAGTLPGIPIDPIDSRSNRAEVAVRYSPMNQLGVKAEYVFENVKRDNVTGWNDLNTPSLNAQALTIVPFQNIPDQQNIHTVRFSVNSRPVRSVDFKGTLQYMYTEEPAYPTSPKDQFKGSFDGSWVPSTELSVGAHYRFTDESNGFSGMSNRNDNPGVQVVWTPFARVFMAAGYDYFRNRNDRNIDVSPGLFNLPFERVPYRDQAHVYSISGGYSFESPLSLEAEFHQSFSNGLFRTTDGVTDGLGELTDQDIRETGGSLTARYALGRGWGSSMTYRINDYQDLKDKPQNGPQDGTAHTLLVMLTKKW